MRKEIRTEKLKEFVDSNKHISKLGRYIYKAYNQTFRKKKNLISTDLFDETIFKVSEIALSEKLEIWPAFGTLLGIYRDNGPIAHDIDIDFAAWFESRDKVRKVLQKNGFKCIREFQSLSIPNAYEELYKKGSIEFDMFYFSEKNGSNFTYDFLRCPGITKVDEDGAVNSFQVRKLIIPVGKVKNYNYKSKTILVPGDVELHLSSRYGSDYMIPNPKWTTYDRTEFEEYLTKDGSLNFI